MRIVMLSLFCSLTLAALPARAQQTAQQTPAPLVDAAGETWQINSEPLLLDGFVYAPGGASRFFDPNVMVRTGVYRGIPVYQDRTLEPSSIIYVPVAGKQMRPYERRRVGELAETVGSRTPSFPVEPATEASDDDLLALAAATRPVGTAGFVSPRPTATVPAVVNPAPQHTSTTAGATSHEPNGIYIEFDGARWYGSGRAVSYSPAMFTPAGTYSGVTVYRLKTDHRNRIWVPVVAGGPLAPYSKR